MRLRAQHLAQLGIDRHQPWNVVVRDGHGAIAQLKQLPGDAKQPPDLINIINAL